MPPTRGAGVAAAGGADLQSRYAEATAPMSSFAKPYGQYLSFGCHRLSLPSPKQHRTRNRQRHQNP